MKKINALFAGLLLTASVCCTQQAKAQAPQHMGYQSVIRNSSNALVAATPVGIQISLLQGTASGTAVYVETQTATTNANGLVSIEIGAGTATTGTFSEIDWATGPYFIKTEIDPAGGSNYTITGTQQMASVPYALYAKTSGNGQGPAGKDGTNGLDGATGPQGADGLDGSNGTNGESAYQVWIGLGNTGTETDFINSLTGPQGAPGATGSQGAQGIDGPQGPAGANGTNGTNGLDGNGIASTTDNGDGTFKFTYNDGSTFTTSNLTGSQGAQGIQGIAGINGAVGATGPQGIQGIDGPQGPAGNNGMNGANGLDGNGITSTTDNGDGTFTLTFDDGSTFVTSNLTGPQGATGSLPSGAIAGNTPYWNGSAWVVNNSNIHNNGAGVGIGTTSPNASAKVEIAGTTQGFLPPRLTSAERDAIASPAVGLVIYNTTTNCLNFYVGSDWNETCGIASSPSLESQYPAGSVFCAFGPTAIVDVTNPTTGKIWMDRNLGATQVATSSTDANSYGDLYQWGRRSDGHQCRTSPTTTTLSSVNQPANGNFILAPNTPGDWRSPQNTNLWQRVNGVNNPCPSGYRLPSVLEFDAELLSWSANTSSGAFASPLRLPMAGYRILSDGSLDLVGTVGFYWSGTVNLTNSLFLYFDSSFGDSYYTAGRAYGLSVRCLKD